MSRMGWSAAAFALGVLLVGAAVGRWAVLPSLGEVDRPTDFTSEETTRTEVASLTRTSPRPRAPLSWPTPPSRDGEALNDEPLASMYCEVFGPEHRIEMKARVAAGELMRDIAPVLSSTRTEAWLTHSLLELYQSGRMSDEVFECLLLKHDMDVRAAYRGKLKSAEEKGEALRLVVSELRRVPPPFPRLEPWLRYILITASAVEDVATRAPGRVPSIEGAQAVVQDDAPADAESTAARDVQPAPALEAAHASEDAPPREETTPGDAELAEALPSHGAPDGPPHDVEVVESGGPSTEDAPERTARDAHAAENGRVSETSARGGGDARSRADGAPGDAVAGPAVRVGVTEYYTSRAVVLGLARLLGARMDEVLHETLAKRLLPALAASKTEFVERMADLGRADEPPTTLARCDQSDLVDLVNRLSERMEGFVALDEISHIHFVANLLQSEALRDSVRSWSVLQWVKGVHQQGAFRGADAVEFKIREGWIRNHPPRRRGGQRRRSPLRRRVARRRLVHDLGMVVR